MEADDSPRGWKSWRKTPASRDAISPYAADAICIMGWRGLDVAGFCNVRDAKSEISPERPPGRAA